MLRTLHKKSFSCEIGEPVPPLVGFPHPLVWTASLSIAGVGSKVSQLIAWRWLLLRKYAWNKDEEVS